MPCPISHQCFDPAFLARMASLRFAAPSLNISLLKGKHLTSVVVVEEAVRDAAWNQLRSLRLRSGLFSFPPPLFIFVGVTHVLVAPTHSEASPSGARSQLSPDDRNRKGEKASVCDQLCRYPRPGSLETLSSDRNGASASALVTPAGSLLEHLLTPSHPIKPALD